MSASERAVVNEQRQPYLRELVRLDAEEAVIADWLQELAQRTAGIRARRREIDRALLDIDSMWREGETIRRNMRRSA